MSAGRGHRPGVVILVGVVALTWAAILVRWADAPAISIAFWRMALAAALLLAFCGVARIRFWRAWRGIDWWTGAGAALLLALHFVCWIASLEYTSVAASGVLVSTQPVFVAILGRAILHERPSRQRLVRRHPGSGRKTLYLSAHASHMTAQSSMPSSRSAR